MHVISPSAGDQRAAAARARFSAAQARTSAQRQASVPSVPSVQQARLRPNMQASHCSTRSSLAPLPAAPARVASACAAPPLLHSAVATRQHQPLQCDPPACHQQGGGPCEPGGGLVVWDACGRRSWRLPPAQGTGARPAGGPQAWSRGPLRPAPLTAACAISLTTPSAARHSRLRNPGHSWGRRGMACLRFLRLLLCLPGPQDAEEAQEDE